MYVKPLENVAIFSFSPRKTICMVPSFLINPDMDRDYNGRYRLKINPDKLLNRKTCYWRSPDTQPSPTSGPDGTQPLPAQTSGPDISGPDV